MLEIENTKTGNVEGSVIRSYKWKENEITNILVFVDEIVKDSALAITEQLHTV